jgi:hypothetical protein
LRKKKQLCTCLPLHTHSAASRCPISVPACLLLAQVATVWTIWEGGRGGGEGGSIPDTDRDIILLLVTWKLALGFSEHLCNEWAGGDHLWVFGRCTRSCV